MARLMSTGAAAKRTAILRELQALLAMVSQVNGGHGVRYPAGWFTQHPDARMAVTEVIPGTARVIGLQLAVERLTGLPSSDMTVKEAVDRIHHAEIEIRA